jgi:hypothetical protein
MKLLLAILLLSCGRSPLDVESDQTTTQPVLVSASTAVRVCPNTGLTQPEGAVCCDGAPFGVCSGTCCENAFCYLADQDATCCDNGHGDWCWTPLLAFVSLKECCTGGA